MSGADELRVSDWPETILVLLLLMAPGAFLWAFLVGIGAVSPALDGGAPPIQILLAMQSLNCVLVTAWFLARRHRPPFGRARVWPTAGIYFLFMVAWIPFVAFVYSWFLQALGAPLEPQPQLRHFVEVDFGGPAAWGSLLAVAFLAPIAEEIVFRGYLYGVFKSAWGTRSALLLTSAIFGLIHSLENALPLALLGLLFGWLRERNGGLAAPIMVHMLHNVLTVVAVVLFPSLLGV